MTNEQRLEKLEREMQAIRTATDVQFVAELRRRLSGLQVIVETGASLTGTTVAVRNSSNTGTELVADDYDSAASLYLNGVLIGRIGLYN